ncbi:xyl1 [Symbiodinium microadriaticum]|nr:xyl1 [Symbiodinium microadriaticum]
MPVVGLGTWKIGKDEVANTVYEAIRAGVRHLDCACDYGNEVEVGHGIKRAIADGICTRQDLWITSKLWNTYHAREHVKPACQKSLSDMDLDYFDLYLIHFPISQRFVPIEVRYPPEWIYDPTSENPRIELQPVPYAETWAGMEDLVNEGLVKNIGVANLVAQSLMDLMSYCRIRPVVNQVEMHPYLVQAELLEYCEIAGIHVTAFSPLGSSSYMVFGMDGGRGTGVLKEAAIAQIAARKGKSPAQIVLRWHIQRGVSIIPKSSKVERIVENFSLFDFDLSEEEMKVITEMDCNARFNNPGVFCKGMGGAIPIFG